MKAKWLEKEEEQEQKEFLAIFRQGGPTNYIEIKERPRPHTAQIMYRNFRITALILIIPSF